MEKKRAHKRTRFVTDERDPGLCYSAVTTSDKAHLQAECVNSSMLASSPLSAEAVQSLVDVVQEEVASSSRSSGGKLPRNHSNSSLCSVSSTSSRKVVLAKKVALRKGKWTEEEELYTKKLIDSFNDGLLLKIPHGTTLRTLLSEKLWW